MRRKSAKEWKKRGGELDSSAFAGNIFWEKEWGRRDGRCGIIQKNRMRVLRSERELRSKIKGECNTRLSSY